MYEMTRIAYYDNESDQSIIVIGTVSIKKMRNLGLKIYIAYFISIVHGNGST